MKLSTLTAPRPTQATLEILDEKIVVTYDRALITRAFFEARKGTPVRDTLSELLISWDVTGDDGKPYQPPASANGSRPAEWLKLFTPIPEDLIMAVYRGILDDFYAGKPAGDDSSAS
jgi:hypothetical protein